MDPRNGRTRRFGMGLALAVLIGLTSSSAVEAREANGQASCMGIELSAISPPGTSDELPGGAPQFVREVRSIAHALGLPTGAIVAIIARLHAGGHEACDAALS